MKIIYRDISSTSIAKFFQEIKQKSEIEKSKNKDKGKNEKKQKVRSSITDKLSFYFTKD